MDRLVDVASMLRSKNSGPFLITLDIFFSDLAAYRRVMDTPRLVMNLTYPSLLR